MIYTPPPEKDDRWPCWVAGLFVGAIGLAVYIPVTWVLWAWYQGPTD